MLISDKIAFDVGAYSTRVVVGKGSINSIVVNEAFSFNNPSGLVEDGHIMDVDVLKEEILDQLDDRRIRTKNAVFTIASTKTIMREIVLPYTTMAKVEAMLPFELAKHMPITVDDYVIKHIPLEVFREDKHRRIRVMVVALPKFMVKRYWELCTSADLKPVALTIHLAGAAHLLQNKNDDPQETMALLDLGHTSINCSIIQGGKLVFNRLIPLAKKEFNETGKEDFYDNTNLRAVIDKWVEEIKMVIRFYLSLKRENRIDKIILFGGGANIKNIATYMADKLERQVHVLRGVSKIKYRGNENFPLNLYFNAATALLF